MFRDSLRRLVEQTQGGIAGLLMGFDGIAVESFLAEPKKLDMQTVSMEFSFILSQVRKAVESIDTGGLEELVVRTERLTLIFRVITKDYFVALAVAPTGNAAKGRYLMRVTAPKIQAEL
jgi:predicted regulator of Ras-like GTPase activity (Roadblock/LC7/MglB family)